MQRVFIVLFLVSLFGVARGQKFTNYESKWQINIEAGANSSFNTLSQGHLTDHLIMFSKNPKYVQPIGVSYFFSDRWGVGFRFRILGHKELKTKEQQFEQEIVALYDADYYVTPSTSGAYFPRGAFTASNNHALFDLIYRFEKDRLFIYPKLSIGSVSMRTDWGKVNLKQRDGNNRMTISYDSGKRPNGFASLSLSLDAGYKLSRKFYLYANATLSGYKAKINFEKETADLAAHTTTIEYFPYKEKMRMIALGFGVTYVLKNE